MEFRMMLQIISALVLGSFVCDTLGNKVETQGTLTEYMSRVPTLTCKFVSSDSEKKWIYIRWERVLEDNSTVPLAIMTSWTRTVEWSDTAPKHFKDHVYLKSEVKDGEVSLNMRIDGFICSDAGRFKCMVSTYSGDHVGYTNLNIEAHPGTPEIRETVLEASENDTFRIECSGNVGIPPQELRWAYKMAGQETYSLLTKSITRENRPTADCTIEELSIVSLVMVPELDGAVFLCMSRGELGEGGKPMNFDEVTVVVYRPPTTTTTQLPSTVIIIDDSDENAAVQANSSAMLLISTCVLSIAKMLFNNS